MIDGYNCMPTETEKLSMYKNHPDVQMDYLLMKE